MVNAYIKERYGPEATIDWNDYLKDSNFDFHTTDFGFVTYRLQGDAVIMGDIYIKPEHRNQKNAWMLHDDVMNKAKKHNKRVAIGFSDFIGQNHILGLQAMKAAGFVPAYKTNDQFVFLKGI